MKEAQGVNSEGKLRRSTKDESSRGQLSMEAQEINSEGSSSGDQIMLQV
jgi:hypothetical protein